MALTTTLEEQRKRKNSQQAQSAGNAGDASLQRQTAQNTPAQAAGTNMRGVSAGTQAGLGQYGQRYTPSQAVTDAQSYLQSKIDAKPGDYQSPYSGAIASLYEQIMNRPKFSYDVNKDPLFQQYKNQYVTQGQRAMQDVMGQAAALTGGYGNSWGSTAGYQAYQAYLQQLNSAIPELEQRAFDRYQAEGDELRNNMQLNTTLDEIGYGRYRDTVADWQAEREFANQLYSQERGWDQSDWQRMQQYYQTMAQLENSDYWQGENFAENQRQFNENLAENRRQYDNTLQYNYYSTNLDEAFRRDQLAENARQYDSTMEYNYYNTNLDEAFRRDQLAENQRQADMDEAYRQAQAAEAVRQYNQNFDYQKYLDALDEAYRQAQFNEGVRQYNQNFGEDQRQFDAQQALNQAKFDLQLRQYEDALAAAQGGGGSGGGSGAAQSSTSSGNIQSEKLDSSLLYPALGANAPAFALRDVNGTPIASKGLTATQFTELQDSLKTAHDNSFQAAVSKNKSTTATSKNGTSITLPGTLQTMGATTKNAVQNGMAAALQAKAEEEEAKKKTLNKILGIQ